MTEANNLVACRNWSDGWSPPS